MLSKRIGSEIIISGLKGRISPFCFLGACKFKKRPMLKFGIYIYPRAHTCIRSISNNAHSNATLFLCKVISCPVYFARSNFSSLTRYLSKFMVLWCYTIVINRYIQESHLNRKASLCTVFSNGLHVILTPEKLYYRTGTWKTVDKTFWHWTSGVWQRLLLSALEFTFQKNISIKIALWPSKLNFK